MKDKSKYWYAGIIVIVMCAVFGAVVMLLWNALLPRIFGLPRINYLEAAGLLLLMRVLLGGLGGNMHGRGGGRRGMREGGRSFRNANRLREKWMNMSEDERKEFIKNERDFAEFHKHYSRFHGFFDDEEGNEQNSEDGARKENSNE